MARRRPVHRRRGRRQPAVRLPALRPVFGGLDRAGGAAASSGHRALRGSHSDVAQHHRDGAGSV